MKNEGYRQCIVQMLYLMDREEDNEVLKEIYTIARYQYIKMAPDRRKQIDKCRGIVFRIIAGMDQERVRQLYNLLVGHYRFSGERCGDIGPLGSSSHKLKYD